MTFQVAGWIFAVLQAGLAVDFAIKTLKRTKLFGRAENKCSSPGANASRVSKFPIERAAAKSAMMTQRETDHPQDENKVLNEREPACGG